jgi:hypothetical protein
VLEFKFSFYCRQVAERETKKRKKETKRERSALQHELFDSPYNFGGSRNSPTAQLLTEE